MLFFREEISIFLHEREKKKSKTHADVKHVLPYHKYLIIKATGSVNGFLRFVLVIFSTYLPHACKLFFFCFERSFESRLKEP